MRLLSQIADRLEILLLVGFLYLRSLVNKVVESFTSFQNKTQE